MAVNQRPQVAQPFHHGLEFRLPGTDVDLAHPDGPGLKIAVKGDETARIEDAGAQDALLCMSRMRGRARVASASASKAGDSRGWGEMEPMPPVMGLSRPGGRSNRSG